MNRRDFSKLASLAALTQAPQLRQVLAQAAPGAMRPRLSIMLWTLGRQLPAEVALDIVAKAGYPAVELLNVYKNWKPADMVAFKAKLRTTGIVVDSMVTGGFAVNDPEKTTELVEAVKTAIPYAKELGCSQFILTPNGGGGNGNRVISEQTREMKRQVIVDTFKRLSDVTARDNIEVLLEPIDSQERKDSVVQSVTEGFEIARAVDRPNVKILYDFYHEQRDFGNLLRKLDGNLDLIGLVHVAEVPKRTEPGTGEIDFSAIYHRLAELKYSRCIAMEFIPTGDPVAILTTARLEVEKAFGWSR